MIVQITLDAQMVGTIASLFGGFIFLMRWMIRSEVNDALTKVRDALAKEFITTTTAEARHRELLVHIHALAQRIEHLESRIEKAC